MSVFSCLLLSMYAASTEKCADFIEKRKHTIRLPQKIDSN